MNELIERLAREAGLIQGILVKSPSRDDLEAFAKAVAREAAGIAELCDDTDHAYRMILARFGL